MCDIDVITYRKDINNKQMFIQIFGFAAWEQLIMGNNLNCQFCEFWNATYKREED